MKETELTKPRLSKFMKVKISKSQWQEIGKTSGWIKLSHHEKEYSPEVLNMTVMQLLDKLENSQKSEEIALYHKIEDYLDSLAKPTLNQL